LSRPVKKVRRGREQACGAWHCVGAGDERGLQIHEEQAVHRRCGHRGIVSAWQTRSQHSWHTFAPDHRSCATARICERGSHAELMAAGGLYAELFELQARAYR
jgi:ATP-binding cassette, subfamily B, bacterial